ncbi:MAG: ATP-binding protein [Bacteroides sp.]|nr:ATP-binding protein [Bacteroides sp.]
MAITNKIGAPVTGEDFFGRKKELASAHRYLNEKQSILLSAPRRIGKSSIAKRLIHDKEKENWKCVYVDLQGIATKEAFLRKLIDAFNGIGLLDKATGKIRDLADSMKTSISGLSFGDLKIDLNNRAESESLFNRLTSLLNHNNDTLIVVDELPLFLGKLMDKDSTNRDEVEFFLNWFRSLRQYENSKIRWLFCGSVGLRNFTNHYRMSQTINDLVDLKLGELPENEANGLLEALSKSYNLGMNDSVITETLELLQWPIPYFIQLLIDRLISNIDNPESTPVNITDVTKALDELSKSDYFLTWDERLNEYRDLETTARKILDNLAKSEQGLTPSQIYTIAMGGQEVTNAETMNREVTRILDMLEHDGYLLRNANLIKFRSPLLRKWWRYKFMI